MQKPPPLTPTRKPYSSRGKRFQLISPEAVLIKGDQLLLKRLIANALSNGERYAKELIQITLTPAEKYVTCTIIDDGPGISDEELELFGERKYGRKYSSAFGHLSMGLGSLIMKKITAQLGGHLKIERRKNAEGTTLTLVLLLSSQ